VLFFSAVTAEFGALRDPLSRTLSGQPNCTVKSQEDFTCGGGTLLEKLDAYIRDCHAVIHLVGREAGFSAPKEEVAELIRPKKYHDLTNRLKFLSAPLNQPHPDISYTQWEAYLALYHRRPLYIYRWTPDGDRSESDNAIDALGPNQRVHFDRLRSLGKDRGTFPNEPALRERVLSDMPEFLALGRQSALPTRRVVISFLCAFGGAVAVGRNLPSKWFSASPSGIRNKSKFVLWVFRPGFDAKPLEEMTPLQSGDSIQARFHVAGGVHASLVYVNGNGRLEVLQSYEPREATFEAVWPGPNQGRELLPPLGTDFFFVCGRRDRAATQEELLEAWTGETGWPPMEPPGQCLLVKSEEITVGGVVDRDLGKITEFPDGDRVKLRLERFRGRLEGFAILDGVAFRHT